MRRLLRIIFIALIVAVLGLPLMPAQIALAATNTLNIYSSGSDGYISSYDSGSYATAQSAASGTHFSGTTAAIGQKTGFYVYRGFIYTDTSVIPDSATITGATLYVYGSSDSSIAEFDIVVRSGMPTYPHDPLVGEDFDKTFYSGDGGSINTSTFTTSGYNAIVLDATGYGWINKTGTTKFALISQEDIDASEPTTSEYVYIWIADQAGTDKDPYLSVTYTYTGIPDVVTQAASNIEDFTATLNGLLAGADSVTKRGFDWGTSISYDYEWIEEGSYDVGTFSHNISNLSPGITYHFRAKAYDATYGWGYGSDITLIKQGTGVLVGTSTASILVGYYGFTHQLFYANGRHWAFYSDGTDLVSKNSPDGISWSSATVVVPGFTTFASNQFDVWFDGTYFHYSRGKPDTANYAIYYRRGLPNSNGTITWSASEQIALAADASYQFDNANIAADTNGYPWIGYVRHPSTGADTTSRAFITRPSTNDGTWTTAGGYPYMLEDIQMVQYSRPTPLTDGKVYVVYSSCSKVVKGRLWDGSSWGSVETASTSLNDDYQVSAVAYGDDIHVVFVKVAPKAAIHIKRTYGVGWGSETNLGNPTASAGEFPMICANWNGDVYMLWANYPTNQHIYYLKYTRATDSWDATVETANDWITETGVATAKYSTLPNTPDGKIGFLYQASATDVKYAYLNAPPSILVTTNTATSIEETSAVLQGTLVEDGGETCSVRFQWGSTPALGSDTIWQGGKTSGNVFSQSITGLTESTLYYYRAQAKWADGTTGNGNVLTFTSAGPEPPITTTNDASSVSQTMAMLNGTLDTLGGYSPVYVSFEYGTTTAYGDTTVEQSRTIIGAFEAAVLSLSADTLYHFRARVRYNSLYVYGADNTFTTPAANTPVISTGSATNVGDTSATLQGSLTSLGSYSPVYVYFQYGATTSYGMTTSEQSKTAICTFSQSISSLSQGTTYHFRAVVKYNSSYIYGADATFTTTTEGPPAEPGIDPPDVLRIDDVKVFRGYLEPNDQLYVIAYRIIYTAGAPILDVGDYFDFQLLDGTVLRAQVPVQSWGYRPGCIYLSVDSALAWGGSYRIKIIGAPERWETPPECYRDLTPGDWQGSDLTQLDTWVMSLANSLQSFYDIEMVTYTTGGQAVLSDQGGAIFNMGILGLGLKRPHLFSPVWSGIPAPAPEDYEPSVIDPEERVGSYVFELFEGAADFFNMEATTFGGFTFGIGYLLLAIVIGAMIKSGLVGMGLASPVIIVGAWFGLIPMALVAVIAGIFVLYAVFTIWMKGT